MASVTLTLKGEITGLPDGTETLSLTFSNSNASGQATFTTLASGANTITVPSGAEWVIIVPPVGNTTSLTLKGLTGDTGLTLHPSQPCGPLSLASSVSSFCVTAGALMTSPTLFRFL